MHGALAACGAEYLPNTKENNLYTALSGLIEHAHATVNDLFKHEVIDAATNQGFYSARESWRAAWSEYQTYLQRFENEINLTIKAAGEDRVNHCGMAESESKSFVKSQSALKVYTDIVTQSFKAILKRTPITNDALSENQFYLKLTKLDRATLPATDTSIVIAVIDDGVYINHEDLRDNIWINTKEVIGNGLDDDGNGYVDDIYGYDFYTNTSEMTVSGGHGTHVAGIIGALTNNGLGIQGIVRKVKLMPLIACDPRGGCPISAVSKAIHYAVDNGASIINLSLSSRGTTSFTTEYTAPIRYAFEHGVLVVAAAGNGDIEGGSGQNLDVIPQSPVCNDGEQNMTLGVGAVSDLGDRATWSNYGTNCVDIYAPGEDVLSTAVPTLENRRLYTRMDGTSFAAPSVTGIAALLKQKYPEINPREIIEHLKKTAWHGVVDAAKALETPYDRYPLKTTLPALPRTPTPPLPPPAPPGTPAPSQVTSSTLITTNSTLEPSCKPNEELDTKLKLCICTRGYSIKLDGTTCQPDFSDQARDDWMSEQLRQLTAPNNALIKKLKGRILLQIEDRGEAWYLDPISNKRYYLKDGATAYAIMRKFGLGITTSELMQIPRAGQTRIKTTTPKKLLGRIVLQVQQHGEAWYIHPVTGERYYLKDGAAAYQLMRELGLGIKNIHLRKIPIRLLE